MSILIFSGRFQPLHNGHIKFLETVKKNHPNELLVICIIRNSRINSIADDENSFNKVASKKHTIENNPLPNWNRYMLLKLAIESNPLLRNNTEVLFRDRSDLDWEKSLQDLPEDRVWLFPQKPKEKFDKEKYNYYIEKNELVEIIRCEYEKDISGTLLRKQLRQGILDLSFMPRECRDYFQNECLKYFTNGS